MLVVLPFMFALSVTVEMSFALPGKGHVAPNGSYVSCEALAPRAKSYSKPRCSNFGSVETNPLGFVLALASLGALGIVVWLSCRPGRGLRWTRDPRRPVRCFKLVLAAAD